MGSKESKQTKVKEKKIDQSHFEHESTHRPASYASLPQQQQRTPPSRLKHPNDRLIDHSNNRPIELSYLQQNNNQDNYRREHNHHHHHHHSHGHDQRLQRIPLAINRWPKYTEQSGKEKSKSFRDEYVHQ